MIIRKISLLCFLLLGLSAFTVNAQIGSTYSMVGLGDVSNGGFGQSAAMGGMGIGLRSNEHLNNLNPASFTALDSLSVLYELGLSGGFNKVESSISSQMKQDTRIDFIALGFKAKPYWGMSFGISPTTRVNYTLLSRTETENNNYNTFYHGKGGLSRIYWTNSFNVLPNLSIGLRAAYVFGNIQRITSVVFDQSSEYTMVYTNNTKYEYKINVNDFAFDYGVQYTMPLQGDNKMIFGLVYENKMKMNTSVDVFGITTKDTMYTEGIDYDIESGRIVDTIVSKENVGSFTTLPSSFGGGLTYKHKDNFLVGADIYVQNWTELVSEDINDIYENSITYRGGLEWTPDKNSINSYIKRIRYRFGGHYTNSHLVLASHRITDYGASFGFGFPMRNSNTSFNISGEIGQRGTTEQNLLKETYGIISLNLSLSDIWFFKRKFK